MNPRRPITDPVIAEEAWQAAETVLGELRSEMQTTLLPHQLVAYKQFEFAKRMGIAVDLKEVESKTLEQFLNLSEEQKQVLESVLKDYKEEMEHEINDLVESKTAIVKKSRKEAFSNLSSKQRAEYDQLIGVPLKQNSGK